MSNHDFFELDFLPVKLLSDTAKLPTRTHYEDAGLDLYSDETCVIFSNSGRLINTGIAIELPKGYCGLLWDRSGLGSKGLHRHCGVIDSSFRGEIKVYLFNHSKKPIQIWRGNKIIQMLIQKVKLWHPLKVEKLTSTERGNKGFGSSDEEVD